MTMRPRHTQRGTCARCGKENLLLVLADDGVRRVLPRHLKPDLSQCAGAWHEPEPR